MQWSTTKHSLVYIGIFHSRSSGKFPRLLILGSPDTQYIFTTKTPFSIAHFGLQLINF